MNFSFLCIIEKSYKSLLFRELLEKKKHFSRNAKNKDKNKDNLQEERIEMATINLTNCDNIRIDICYHQILNFPGEKILFHNEIERENHIAR